MHTIDTIATLDTVGQVNTVATEDTIATVDIEAREDTVAIELEGTARYAGLLLAPAEGFGLRPRLFLPFGKKRAYYAVLANFWQFLVSSSNLANF